MLAEVTVDLNELLREMHAGYEISSPTFLRAADDLPAMVHYIATPRVPDPDGPTRIQLWAEAATGQLDRMICSGLRTRHPRNRYELVVTLLALDPLPEDWFLRRAHEDGE